MTSGELERWLRRHGCVVERDRGKGGHCLVRLGDKKTILPSHGKNKELPLGTVHSILKSLGLKEESR